MELFFWAALLLLGFTYAGYPLVLALLSPFRSRPAIAPGPFTPTISVLTPARNAARHIQTKIRDIARIDYPPEKTEIIIVDDGSEDQTASLARRELDELERRAPYAALRLIEFPKNLGKAEALNAAVRQATGDILILTDVDCLVAPESIPLLVRPFTNPIVGCVAGRYAAAGVRGRNTHGVGFYWRYENYIRAKESEAGGLLGASGALYAMRRVLYEPLRPGLINDDFVLPMSVALKGYRTLYEPRALATEDESRNEEQEFSRRVRIMTGNCQHMIEFRSLLGATRQRRRPLVQMICHKLLRVLSPFFLIAIFVANTALVLQSENPRAGFYQLTLAAQILCYIAAAAGYFKEQTRRLGRLVSLPYYFAMINLAALLGVYNFLFRHARTAWGQAPSTENKEPK